MKEYTLSIVIPMLNELNSLKKTLKIINKIKIKKEFLIIIAKAKTNSENIKELFKLKKKYNSLKLLYQSKPFVGGAIQKGIDSSRYTHIALMASDLETNPYDLKKLVKKSIEHNNKIIVGDRWIKKKAFQNYGFVKKMLNYFVNKLLSILLDTKINDITFAYRIYPRKALKFISIDEYSNGWALELFLKPLKKGYEFIGIPTTWKKRNEGNSSNFLKSMFSFVKTLYKNI